MTTAQVVETSVTANNNGPIQDYVHPDDQTQPLEMTPGFKPFTYLTELFKTTTAVLFNFRMLFNCLYLAQINTGSLNATSKHRKN